MYENFYKLNTSPFKLAADPLFFFDSDSHRHGLIQLRQALQKGKEITLVTGEPGTGKTELMRKFSSELDSNNTVVATIPPKSLRSNNILDYIAAAFGVVNMGFVGDALWFKSALLGKIQQQVNSGAGEGKRYIVLIDNAESLGEGALEKLVQLCSVSSQGKALVQCFMFGETSASERIQGIVMGNTLAAHLSALPESESRRYIEHRLMQAGWQGDPEITDSAHNLIYQISEGIPWHINMLCHRIFLQGFLENVHTIDERLVRVFQTEKELEHLEVSGSDVSVATNVVNLTNVNSSRDVVSSVLPGYLSGSDNDGNFNEFSHGGEVPPILVDDVQSALDLCHKEMSAEEKEPDTKRDSVVDKILSRMDPISSSDSVNVEFSDNLPGMDDDETSSSLDLPDANPDDYYGPRSERLPVQHKYKRPESFVERHNMSPVQIATSASIATSLVITVMIALLSDSGPSRAQVAQMIQSNMTAEQISSQADSTVNSITPSPFENPDDVTRARAVLKK